MLPVPPPPPLPHRMPRGTTLLAGLGVSTVLADLDFETYSEAGLILRTTKGKQRWAQPDGATGTAKGLPLVGSSAYSEHPSTEVLTCAYDLKDGKGARLWLPGMPAPRDLFDHLASGALLEAWNVSFERNIWRNVCMRRYGWPDWPIRQQRDAMAKARAFGIPGKLETAAEVLGAPIQKDKDGKRLLDKFSVPRNPTNGDPRLRIHLHDDPADGQRLIGYNITDIEAEAGVSALCPDLEGEELEFWLADQEINARGVHIDRAGVENCIAMVALAHEQYNAELCELTGGVVKAASELSKLQGWIGAQGWPMASMDEDAIGEALAQDDMPPAARRALEIRQAIGSASVKKVRSMAMQVCADDRVREIFAYHGAATGRAAGRGPQPQNLPKAGPKVYRCGCGRHGANRTMCTWCGMPRPPNVEDVEWGIGPAEDALLALESRDLATVERHFGDAMLAVSGSLRSLFTAAPGHELVCGDFSSIEAVVLAALAGEQWRLDVLTAKRDIYLESASRITGTPYDTYKRYKAERGMHHPHRQAIGKPAELGLGYGGWIGAWRNFGGPGDDAEVKANIVAWRNASPAVVEFWGGQSRNFGRQPGMFGLEGAAVQAVQWPGQEVRVMRLGGMDSNVAFLCRAGVLYMRLPSGRHITYHRPRLRPAQDAWRGLALTYEGMNTNQKKGAPGWQTMDLYSGVLANNCVQGTARDIQRFAILGLERAGYPVVLHVHDENVSEVPEGHGSNDEFQRIMGTLPAWAAGWPIRVGEIWRGPRYRKE